MNSGKDNSITSITFSSNGFIYYGTKNNTLVKYNPNTHSIMKIVEETGREKNENILFHHKRAPKIDEFYVLQNRRLI